MDAVLTAVLQSSGPLAGGVSAVAIIVLLLRRESATEERHTAELTRLRAAHDDELGELRADIKALRKQVDDLQTTIDLERDQRRAAEDKLAEWMRRRGDST